VPLQQEELIVQLQEQHFEQYMEHIHSQLLLHQRQQCAQLRALATGGRADPVPAFNEDDQRQIVEFQTEDYGHQNASNGDDVVSNKKVSPSFLAPLDIQRSMDELKADGNAGVEENCHEDPLLDGRGRKYEVPLNDEAGEDEQESDVDDQESGLSLDWIIT
jgi:hypothetical protein